jgi:serine protease
MSAFPMLPYRFFKPAHGCRLITVFAALVIFGCGSGGGSGNENNSTHTATVPVYTVSGSVAAPTNASVDWDVKDTNATNPIDSNNAINQTQPLFAPTNLVGHVGLNYDTSDFFNVTLTAGQRIALYIAESGSADLDLYLYDSQGQTLDSAMGDGAVETLDVAADGDYIIEVRIVELGTGPPTREQSSIYNMLISTSLAASSDSLRLSDDFVPGEVVVHFTGETATALSAESGIIDRNAPILGMKLTGGAAGRSMRMQFDSQRDTGAVFTHLGISHRALNKAADLNDEGLRRKLRTLEVIKALRRHKDIRYAVPNYIRKAFTTPNDTYYNLQWHFEQISLPEAWDLTTGNAAVIVAVVDSGVLKNHPDMSTKLTGTGYDFVSNPANAGDGDGIDDNPDDPGDQAKTDGSSTFHGTHVAGTVAAATSNGIGVAGAGWSTRVMAIRALGLGGEGTDYDIAQGILYAAGLDNDSGTIPSQPADIINLSLGGESDSQLLSDAIRDARNQGVIIIAAAGNNSSSQPSYPAAYDTVVSVSAVDYAADLAYYSNYGDTIDVAAPGGDGSTDLNADGIGDGILSTLGNDQSGTIEMVYGIYQGTSMAAPHAAGVVALMKAIQPGMTPDDLDALLLGGTITTEIGSPTFFGAGLIDAQKAVLAAQAGALPTLLNVNPTLLGLGIALTGTTITAEKIGDTNGALTVIDVIADAAWLSVTPDTVDAEGLGTYAVSVDRSGLADGAYSGTITIISSENTVAVTVTMQVKNTGGSDDAGYHYVVLVDATTGETAYQQGTPAINGVYDFSFTDVAQGTYRIYAGTNLDGDRYIGDAGEAAGAYLSLDQPQEIAVDQDLSGLDFISKFNININGAISTVQLLETSPFLQPIIPYDER